MKWIGLALVAYAIGAVILLVLLQRWLCKLMHDIADGFCLVADLEKTTLQPLIQAAAAMRRGGKHIVVAAEHINQTVPPAMQAAVRALRTIATSLRTIPDKVADFVQTETVAANDSMAAITAAIDKFRAEILSGAGRMLRDLSRDLYQAPFLMRMDSLKRLEEHDLVPEVVVAALQGVVGRRFESEAELRAASGLLLTQEHFHRYIDKIVKRAVNSDSDKDVVSVLDDTRRAMLKASDHTLAAAEEAVTAAQLPAAALAVLTDIAAGPFAPLARAIKDTAEILLHWQADLQRIRIVVNQGQWGNLEIPSIPIGLSAGTIPEGALLEFFLHMPEGMPNVEFKVPYRNYPLPGLSIPRGKWHQSPLPPTDLEIFDGSHLVGFFTDLEKLADELIHRVRKTPDISLKLREAAGSMKELGDKVGDLARNPNRLPLRVEKLKEQSQHLLELADKVDRLSDEADGIAELLHGEAFRRLQGLKQLSEGLLEAVTETVEQLERLSHGLRNVSLAELLGELHCVAGDLTDSADCLDDGRPIDTPGKQDFVQRLWDLFHTIGTCVSQRRQISRIISGAWVLLIGAHIAIGVIGLVLVYGLK